MPYTPESYPSTVMRMKHSRSARILNWIDRYIRLSILYTILSILTILTIGAVFGLSISLTTGPWADGKVYFTLFAASFAIVTFIFPLVINLITKRLFFYSNIASHFLSVGLNTVLMFAGVIISTNYISNNAIACDFYSRNPRAFNSNRFLNSFNLTVAKVRGYESYCKQFKGLDGVIWVCFVSFFTLSIFVLLEINKARHVDNLLKNGFLKSKVDEQNLLYKKKDDKEANYDMETTDLKPKSSKKHWANRLLGKKGTNFGGSSSKRDKTELFEMENINVPKKLDNDMLEVTDSINSEFTQATPIKHLPREILSKDDIPPAYTVSKLNSKESDLSPRVSMLKPIDNSGLPFSFSPVPHVSKYDTGKALDFNGDFKNRQSTVSQSLSIDQVSPNLPDLEDFYHPENPFIGDEDLKLHSAIVHESRLLQGHG